MKKTHRVAIAVLLSCSLMSPVTPALAVVSATPNSTTLASQNAFCTAAALALGSNYDYLLIQNGTSHVSGPDVVAGSEEEILGTRVGLGIPNFSGYAIVGDPYRHGGSVNLFGARTATRVDFTNSSFQYTVNMKTVTGYNFTCDMKALEGREVTTPGSGTDGNPGRGDCVGNPSTPDVPGGPGRGAANSNPNSACNRDSTTTIEYSWVDKPDVTGSVNEDSFERSGALTNNNGGAYGYHGLFNAGDVVVCNSPTKNPGAWRVQNGYGGGSLTGPAAGCNSAWFAIAPTQSGHNFGETIPSNSLPQ